MVCIMFANVNINEAKEKYSQNIICCTDKCHLFYNDNEMHNIIISQKTEINTKKNTELLA